jgi:hypothetical protein
MGEDNAAVEVIPEDTPLAVEDTVRIIVDILGGMVGEVLVGSPAKIESTAEMLHGS